MELNTYPLVCTRGVVLYPNQEIVIDVGRDTSVHAVENAQDNYCLLYTSPSPRDA